MKKLSKKFTSIMLSLITVFTAFTATSTTALAASYPTNYSSYSAPSSSDYAYWNGSRMVKASGTTKSEIKWMQSALNYCIKYKGLNASYLSVDASFGPATKKTTSAFQKKYGLSQDGSFGPNTIAKMKSVLSQKTSSSSNNSNSKQPTISSTKVTESNVTYEYVTIELDTSSMDNWINSVKKMENYLCTSNKGVIIASKVISRKTVSWKVSKAAVYQGPGITGYITQKYSVPSKVQYKLHKHTKNHGFGKSWYYSGGNIVSVYTCDCGYRREIMEWTIPFPDTSDAQTTQKVIQGLPQIN